MFQLVIICAATIAQDASLPPMPRMEATLSKPLLLDDSGIMGMEHTLKEATAKVGELHKNAARAEKAGNPERGKLLREKAEQLQLWLDAKKRQANVQTRAPAGSSPLPPMPRMEVTLSKPLILDADGIFGIGDTLERAAAKVKELHDDADHAEKDGDHERAKMLREKAEQLQVWAEAKKRQADQQAHASPREVTVPYVDVEPIRRRALEAAGREPLRGKELNEEILRVLYGEGLLDDANQTLKGLEETQRRVAELQTALEHKAAGDAAVSNGGSALSWGVAIVLGGLVLLVGFFFGGL